MDVITARRSGIAAFAAGPLLAMSSGIELILPVQRPDGTVLLPLAFGALMALWALGMLSVLLAVVGIRELHRRSGATLPRSGRGGVRVLVVGVALQIAFAATSAATALTTGRPAEAGFLLLALGFLLIVVGATMLGVGVRRAGLVRGAAGPLWLGALAAVAAMTLAADPWHDVALFVTDASWSALGLVLLLRARRAAWTGARHPARVPSDA